MERHEKMARKKLNFTLNEYNFKNMDNQLKSHLFKTLKAKYKKCLWPLEVCPNTPIGAHSIQDSKILDKIARDNHLIRPAVKTILETGPVIEFESISRHKATTFTGLCNTHDSELFRPIEQNDIDPNDAEHLFLLAYRAVIKEFHATIERFLGSYSLYNKRFELGKYDKAKNWHEKSLVIGGFYEASEIFLYWENLNDILKTRQFIDLQHVVIELQVSTPTLAVNTFFPLIVNRQVKMDLTESTIFPLPIGGDQIEMVPSLIFNVFPQEQCHLLIFSYLPEHSEHAHTVIRPIVEASGYNQQYLLSKLILKRCDNFVLQPDIFEAFSDKKKEDILRYFKGNYLNYEDEFESEHLMLFPA